MPGWRYLHDNHIHGNFRSEQRANGTGRQGRDLVQYAGTWSLCAGHRHKLDTNQTTKPMPNGDVIMYRALRTGRHNRGGILLTTLVFSVVIATLLAGLGTLLISFYSRVTTESQYASSINLADAGANYEFRKLNQNVSNADLPSTATAVSLGSGTFPKPTVRCLTVLPRGIRAQPPSTLCLPEP